MTSIQLREAAENHAWRRREAGLPFFATISKRIHSVFTPSSYHPFKSETHPYASGCSKSIGGAHQEDLADRTRNRVVALRLGVAGVVYAQGDDQPPPPYGGGSGNGPGSGSCDAEGPMHEGMVQALSAVRASD